MSEESKKADNPEIEMELTEQALESVAGGVNAATPAAHSNVANASAAVQTVSAHQPPPPVKTDK